MISIIKRISKNLLIEPIKPLGRWTIENCNKKIDNKIDLSNEDHCGPCGQYLLSKKTQTPTNEETTNKLTFSKKTKFDI